MDGPEQIEPRQLQHDVPSYGGPCQRCGIKLNQNTAYLPCFFEGDTLKTWVARNAETILMIKGSVPDLLYKMASQVPGVPGTNHEM